MIDDKITDASSAASDKFDQHYRQQLSALMDGALPPDEARFLLRRLQHDSELAQCLDRWHMAGDALRGESQAIVSDGFAKRVAAMVASEPALRPAAVDASRTNRAGLRWASGVALAASVALVALFVTRQPAAPDAAQAAPAVAEVTTSSGQGNAPMTDASSTIASTPAPPSTVAASFPATATASAPPRSIRHGNRSQSQRATIRTPARSERPMVASGVPQGDPAAVDTIFDAPATSRPWPSAVFPQASVGGSFNVDYGSLPAARASSPTFYPFQPRLPEMQRDVGEAPPAEDGSPP